MTSEIELERLKDFIPFDALSDHHLRDVLKNITVHKVPKGKLIFKRGASADKCFFLLEGAVDLADEDFNVENLPADSDDNYLALDNFPQHRVSAITTEPSTLVSINRDHMDLIITWSQAHDSFDEDTTLSDEDADWMDTLLSSEIFARIPPTNIQQLFVKFQPLEAQAGKNVVVEGEEGDRFYVISAGKAIVKNKNTPKDEALAALQIGDYFGQDALIGDSVRNATVTMVTDGTLMYLEKEDFLKLLHTPAVACITEEEYEKMMDEGETPYMIIDVRLPMEHKQDRQPNSKNIPLNELREKAKNLDRDFTYVVYSGGGRRCEIGAHILSEAGFNAMALKNPEQEAPEEKEENTSAETEQE